MTRARLAAIAAAVASIAVAIAIINADGGAGPRTAPARAVQPPRAVAADRSAAVARSGGLAARSAGALRLEGQVRGPDGAEVAGARIALETRVPRATTSELDGSFAFDGLATGAYLVTASAGLLIGGPVRVQLDAASDPVIVHMVAGGALTANVVDERGAPLAGARVELADAVALVATTDAGGRARLAPLRPGEAAIVVSAPGFATTTAVAPVAAGIPATLTIVLREGYAVAGRVLDERGEPVADAQVAPIGGIDGVARDRATTDARGRFVLPGLAAGTVVLAATDGEHAPAYSPPLAIGAGDLGGITLTMRAGGVLRGRVRDRDGHPAAHAIVRVTGFDPRAETTIVRELLGDLEGRFELRGLPRLALEVHAQTDAAASASAVVDLGAEPVGSVELQLDATATISGIVVTADGEPLPEVQVSGFASVDGPARSAGETAAPLVATTDGAGGFVLRGARDGSRYTLAVTSPAAGLRNPRGGTVATAGARDVRLVLVATGGLRGRIALRGTGRPPARATVHIGHGTPVPASGGDFTIAELEPGSYDIALRGDFTERVVAGVRVEAGQVRELGILEVERGRALTGVVVDERGAPIADAQVSVEVGAPVATDRDGRFALEGLSARETRAFAWHTSRGHSEAVAIGSGVGDPPPVRLVLRAGGSLAGQITVGGQPRAGVVVTVAPAAPTAGSPPRTARADERGAFALADLPAGAYRVSAMQASSETSLASATTVVTVHAGARAEVSLDIARGTISLAVQVRAAPQAGATVLLFRGEVLAAEANDLSRAFGDGRHVGTAPWPTTGQPAPTFDALLPGRYSACIVAGDAEVTCQAVTVAASPLRQSVALR